MVGVAYQYRPEGLDLELSQAAHNTRAGIRRKSGRTTAEPKPARERSCQTTCGSDCEIVGSQCPSWWCLRADVLMECSLCTWSPLPTMKNCNGDTSKCLEIEKGEDCHSNLVVRCFQVARGCGYPSNSPCYISQMYHVKFLPQC